MSGKRGARATALVVVSSSCQLYSGTGTALFDWMRYAREEIAFSLLIDTGERINFEIAARACAALGTELIASESEQVPGCPDYRPLAAARVLRERPWTLVECVSWANAATNMEVLENRPPGSRLLYTPHTQPLWTLGEPDRYFMVQPILHRMLAASDLVLIDTPIELDGLPAGLIAPDRVSHIPLGVDTRRFAPAAPAVAPPGERPRILVVADFREHRKRPDLLLHVLESVLHANPEVCPVLIGRGSDQLKLPPLMATRARCLGFVTEDELLRQYRLAHVFLLLSEFEAFGLPIAEALCCGTPVVIHDQAETASVFGGLQGVHVRSNGNLIAVRDTLLDATRHAPDRAAVSSAAHSRFSIEATYGRKLEQIKSFYN